MAELSAADRAHVVQHLEAASRWLTLLVGRLAEGGEPEAAALVDAAERDITEVCRRLSRTASGLPVDPHRVNTPLRRWPAPPDRSADAVGRNLERSGPRKDRAWISLSHVADLRYGRDRWIRWDQELTSTCPECGRAWADHPGGIQLWAQDGHLGRVLPECPQGGASQVAADDAEGS